MTLVERRKVVDLMDVTMQMIRVSDVNRPDPSSSLGRLVTSTEQCRVHLDALAPRAHKLAISAAD